MSREPSIGGRTRKAPASRGPRKPGPGAERSKKSSPAQLTAAQKKSARQAFEAAIEQVDYGDIDYVLVNTIRKIRKLPAEKSLELFVRQVSLLFRALQDSVNGSHRLPEFAIAAITAALTYVISPIDVIPDSQPRIGYRDDILIVEQCLDLLSPQLVNYCKKQGLDPEDYEL